MLYVPILISVVPVPSIFICGTLFNTILRRNLYYLCLIELFPYFLDSPFPCINTFNCTKQTFSDYLPLNISSSFLSYGFLVLFNKNIKLDCSKNVNAVRDLEMNLMEIVVMMYYFIIQMIYRR